ncbi:mitotic checkpoint serine/threonine-protein kinase BUB1 beta [Asbolus verrucosus]|uniref:Mitotic checkpoint serine/threonine-protein kinase BUB1 beta n=1 Tax=Asbolus verrucosus TaxID=1661398 RepID=A0A482WB32_ASBVE|nr:mitotic checkpoint serine/threonine-protein kinase BUB1 beta [Asbolus verrucosus]
MDFDFSKENIQPLRGGRNVSQLGIALQAQTDMEYQRELLQQKGEFEKLIRTYTGDDPLENWYSYISWVEQSYPKQGHEGNLVSLLEYCLKMFESDKRYRDDRRLCRLFIKYIDLQQNPLELYHMMYAQGLCRGCADMYRAWAYYHEAASDFQNAHKVFECGKRELAQPYEELQNAHQNLIMAAGQHIIYGPNERDLSEKRQALTSLCTYKSGHVGSVRNTSSSGPGTYVLKCIRKSSINLFLEASVIARPNASIQIYEDEGEEFRGAEAGPSSIVTAAKRQEVSKENTLKPGSWTTIPVKKRHAAQKLTPSFTVHEDGGDCNDSVKMNNFVTMTSENYSDWIVSLTIPEPKDERMVPMYPKGKVYSEISTEYNAPKNFSAVTEHDEQISGESRSPPQKTWDQSAQQVHNPAGSLDEHQFNFDIWNSPDVNVFSKNSTAPKFPIYEQSNLALQEQIEPKGSAMKTPFKDLNAEELAETGSRGGMDIAAAAPVDSAKRLPIYDDDSSSSFDKIVEPVNFGDLSCNTQMFVFNLNAMKVSTPQSKQGFTVNCDGDTLKNTRKQLFAETLKGERADKALSVIIEEKSYGSSSSSSGGTTTKSSLFINHTKQNNMATISEEHNSYLAQNLMVNAALRSSSLGDLMDFGHHSSPMAVGQKNSSVGNSCSPVPTIPTPAKVIPLNFVPSDPFKQNVIEKLLQRVSFPGPHTRGYYCLHSIPKLLVRKETVCIGSDKYVIEKQLGKGTYGTVFRGVDLRTGNTVALKFQKPANRWEFYICRELQSRLMHHPLRERFMDVRIGYFSEQASILISEFMPCGSLLDVANMVKQKSGRAMKESLCIHFCLEMLKVVGAMHEVRIIHADIKPDNFLVKLFPNDTVGLHLIDFGCSIDMTLFPTGASFTRKVTTEDFICCEMIDGRPWNYHTDLFCVAATAHVLLFEKYIQLQKKDGHWSISNRLPRYARLDLWNMFFSTLLNQQNGPADSASLQAMLEDSLNHKFDDYHNEIRYLINILKNR